MTHPFFEELLSRVNHGPNQTAICCITEEGEILISFSEFLRKISIAATRLSTTSAERGSVVLIFTSTSPEAIYTFLGAQWIGLVPAFMPPPTARQPLELWRESHRKLVERIKPAIIVSEALCVDDVNSLSSEIVAFRTDEITSEYLIKLNETEDPIYCGSDTTAFLQHSSGTTGLKKGVVVSWGTLIEQVRSYSQSLNFKPADDCVVSWLPIYHDMGLIAGTLLPVGMGAKLVIMETFAWLRCPQLFIDALARHTNAFVWMPNFAFLFLANRGKPPAQGNLKSIRAIINCSEPCKAAAMESFISTFAASGLRPETVRVCYAMAENVFAVTQTAAGEEVKTLTAHSRDVEQGIVSILEAGDPDGRPVVSVGRPIPGVDVTIRMGAAVLPSGSIGEIWVTGASLTRGYFLSPEITSQKFVDGWYATGDLGFICDGELYITGRSDDLIIIRGRNLYAHDIEETVSSVQAVKSGRVVAVSSFDEIAGTESLIVLAEAEHGLDLNFKKQYLREIIERVMLAHAVSPRDVVLLEPNSMIKTSSGKVSRSENKRRYQAGSLTSWGRVQ